MNKSRRLASGHFPPLDHPRRWTGGFSLVEIMVTLTIISLMAALAVPAFGDAKRRARATAVANDFRTFAAAFDGYAQEFGAFPPETDAGVLPPEMVNRINANAWTRMTPIGGQYNWENNQLHGGVHYRAAIAITETSSAPLPLDLDQLEAIDRAIDDGDLNTGNFRLGANDEPLFIIAQ
jgi:prepilin-type N-terminal cleavage/methylation domain-containing protein